MKVVEINFFPQIVEALGGGEDLQHWVNFMVVMAVPLILFRVAAFIVRPRESE